MSVRISEKPRQTAKADQKKPSTTREYTCSGSTDRLEVLIALGNGTPKYDDCTDTDGQIQTLYRSGIDLTERGGGVWEAVSRYDGAKEIIELTFNVGVQSAKIFQAIDTIRKYDCVNGGSANDDSAIGDVPVLRNVIGVNGSNVEGVEIEVGKVEFSLSKKVDIGEIPVVYLNTLATFTDRSAVNDAQYIINWLGQQLIFPEGTLRFRGASVKWDNFKAVGIDYHFVYSRGILTADNFTVGASDVITKEGHEYGWIMYRSSTSNGIETKTPLGYIVNKVYPKLDFGLLLINTQ